MSCSHIILDTLFIFVKSLHFFSLVIIRLKNGDEVGVITQFLAEMITPPSTCLTNTFSKERTIVDPRWRTTTITRTNTMKIHLVFRRYCWWDQKRFSNGNPDANLVWDFKIEKIKIIVIEYFPAIVMLFGWPPNPAVPNRVMDGRKRGEVVLYVVCYGIVLCVMTSLTLPIWSPLLEKSSIS